MNEADSVYSSADEPAVPPKIRLIDRIARRAVLRQLERLEYGRLVVSDGLARYAFGGRDGAGTLGAALKISDFRFYRCVAFGGAVGAAEAYMQGYWTSDDLTRLVRLLVRNRRVLDDMEQGPARRAQPLRIFLHWINRNTKAGSLRNIAAHYDLGNEFFGLWLDETMMYSSAVFERPEMTLAQAATAKLDRICGKLALGPDDHVLEIGTGWGGFAIHAAKNYGCRVTTTTISREQFEYARARVERAGLGDSITVLRRDYRDLDGRYDKLVSIEMIEAVGHRYLDCYFECCARLLKPDGTMLLQAITIADQRYKRALQSVDFIQRYIFPGGFLPSVSAMLLSVTKSTDLRLFHLEDIGPHYARTLACWRDRFVSRLNRIRSLGYSEEFLRMWHYYFCYCEGAFTERAIGDVQMLLVKPESRPNPVVTDAG